MLKDGKHSCKTSRAKVQETERIQAIQGTLVMASFRGKDKYKCGIKLENGTYLSNINFDEEVAPVIENALRKQVFAIGIATLDSESHKLKSFAIKQLILMTPDVTSEALAAALAEYIEENDTAAHFRQGFKEALSGKARPIEELWDDIQI